jgi:hypothetical protein
MDQFASDSERTRRVVNREGDGASRGDSPQMINAPIRTPGYCIDVKEKPGIGSETTIGHTGPNAGTAIGGAGKPTDVQGFVSPTGNRVTIDNNMGSDVITMHHHTGATVMIDADGSIHIISTGKKGFGVVAPKGDGAIHAQGHIIIKGESKITLETNGDLDLNVGGNFDIWVGGDMSTYVEGSIEQFTDGRLIQEIVKDHMITVAGDARTTVAGEGRTQVTGNYSLDVGKNFTARADANTSISAYKNMALQSKEDMAMDSQKGFNVKADKAMSVSTKDNMTLASTGDAKFTTKGTMTTHSTGNMDIRSSARVDVNEGGASPVDPATAKVAPQAQYATPEMIIDNMTTVREAPDFPKNAMRMPDSKVVMYKMDGDTINPRAEAAAKGNNGAGAPQQNQERSGETIPPPAQSSYDKPQGISGAGKSEQNPLPIPSSAMNSNEKISRHLTVGHILDIRSCSPDQFQAVIKEAMNTAWNCMDPLIDKYGSRVRISSWFRKGTKNHGTGGAIDFSAMPRGSHDLTAEMAAFLRDNTPTRQLFLEKNNQGGIHVHVWAAPVGSGSNGLVLTCADPGCNEKRQGIIPSFAKAALGIRSA